MQKEPCQLVIFDCDGVLVDTEEFGIGLILELAAPYGLNMSLAEAMKLFTGTRWMPIIEKICGNQLPANFFEHLGKAFAERVKDNIKIIDGVKEAIENINLPICVASNSSRGSIKQMLTLVGLYDYFTDRIFSGYELQKWKPEPDLFLAAAKEMKVSPKNCLVIEDSLAGIQAAKAAEMMVLAYAASEFTGPTLLSCGVPTFCHMNELPQLIQSIQAQAATSTTPASCELLLA